MRSWCLSPKQALIWNAGPVFSPLLCLASLQKCYKVGREEDILPSQHIYIFAVMWGYSAECWQARQWSARTAESGHLGLGLGCGSVAYPYQPISYRQNIMHWQPHRALWTAQDFIFSANFERTYTCRTRRNIWSSSAICSEAIHGGFNTWLLRCNKFYKKSFSFTINTQRHVICLNILCITWRCPGEPFVLFTSPLLTHPPSFLSFPNAPSLLCLLHSSCKEHSTMFLLAELCRLSLRAWKTSVLPLIPAANVHISHIFCLLSVNSSLQPLHIIQAPRHCRTGRDRYVLWLTLHPYPPCLSFSAFSVSH